MKRPVRTLLFGLLAALAFTACGDTALNVPLADFSIQVDAVGYTAGQVVYPKDPTTFNETYVNVKTITVSGNLKVTYDVVQAPLSMTFYARTENPGDAGCTDAGLAWVCSASNETAISGSYSFNNGDEKAIDLGNENPQILAEGLNNGSIWIGAEVTNGIGTNVLFEFSNLVAHVTLF